MSKKYKNASKIVKNYNAMGKNKEIFTADRQAKANEEYNAWLAEMFYEEELKLADDFKQTNLIFVYGTLQQAHGNHRLIQDQEFLSKATTKNKYMLTASGIPFVDKSQAISYIKGELYRLDTTATMANVDSLESHPNWYRREIIDVIDAEGNEHKAWIYFNEDRGMYVIEDGDYTGFINKLR